MARSNTGNPFAYLSPYLCATCSFSDCPHMLPEYVRACTEIQSQLREARQDYQDLRDEMQPSEIMSILQILSSSPPVREFRYTL